MDRLIAFFRLARPANIVTAVSDILAGIAISGFFLKPHEDVSSVVWLILSTVGLYGGGVVMNDVFDAGLDRVERPERPIPSGAVSEKEGAILGLMLLLGGVSVAFLVSTLSGILALTIAVAALVYDKWGKHHFFLGPLNMGFCRGLNLLLGLSIIPAMVHDFWFLALVPIIYIAAITMISRGEVYGGRKSTLYAAAALYVLAMGGISYVSLIHNRILITLLFIGIWAFMVFRPLNRAIQQPAGKMIGRAVKAGVLALILMNAAWAAAFGAIYIALIILLLLPLSILMARVFAVT